MIHKLLIFDNNSTNCALLYDNGKITIDHDLLLRLLKATIQLGQEMDKSLSISLQEIEIGELQIGLLGEDNHTYIVIQDSLDNEAFTRNILDSIIEKFHFQLKKLQIPQDFEKINTYEKQLANFLNTMKFPKQFLPSVNDTIDRFMEKINNFDTLFLTDLDDGIVKIWKEKKNGKIIKILMEILSEMNFEKSWIGEIPLYPPVNGEITQEIWIIYRLGYTDFCLCGRAFYNNVNDRETIVEEIENLTNEIISIIQH